MPKIIQGKFKIADNKKEGLDYFKMNILAPAVAQRAKPGQFVHVRCGDRTAPLLRRPFSFHRINQNTFEIFYKIIGRGTKLLAKKQKGDTIDILGPLGNGFSLERPKTDERRTAILVAGGMGVAPLLALAEAQVKKDTNRERIVVLLGARNKKQIFCVNDFKKLGVKLYITTDDGTAGYKGVVTNLLKKIITASPERRSLGLGGLDIQRTIIYACGPKPMLKEVALLGRRHNISSYASLEENMACGVGACLGCAIKTKAGYKRVCKEGPVLNLAEIKW